MSPLVALVGRPNVGKSTLFNRLVGKPISAGAVVDRAPGTTRDRLYGTVEWRGLSFTLVDTGGIGVDESAQREAPQSWSVHQRVIGQAEAAIREADVVVFLTDVRQGPVPSDVEIAARLRRAAKPVILVGNKADNAKDRLSCADLFELGLGDPMAASAIQGTGTGDLLDRIVAELQARCGQPGVDFDAQQGEDETAIGVAIVGKPNVGKSSLLNAIVGEERAIVDPSPGTTRDAVDSSLDHRGARLVLIDTAGIRRRGKVTQGVETYSVLRAMHAIERADIAVVVLDAAAGITAQDAHVAGYVQDSVKGCVIAVNKWDLVPRTADAGPRHLAALRRELVFLDYAPVVFISASSGLNVRRLLDKVLAVAAERGKRISTSQVNDFFRDAVTAHPLSERGRALKLLYATQASTHPPTFVLFVNDPSMVHFSYRRYLENQLRRRFGFEGTGIRLIFRGRSEGAR